MNSRYLLTCYLTDSQILAVQEINLISAYDVVLPNDNKFLKALLCIENSKCPNTEP